MLKVRFALESLETANPLSDICFVLVKLPLLYVALFGKIFQHAVVLLGTVKWKHFTHKASGSCFRLALAVYDLLIGCGQLMWLSRPALARSE